MKKIYICYTYYHLLISIIKTLNDSKDTLSDIVLAADGKNVSLVENKFLYERLKKSNLFNNIIIFDKSKEQLNNKKSKMEPLKTYLFFKKNVRNCEIKFNSYDEIYIFNDTMLLGRIIAYKKIFYNLIEDGTDCFINNKSKIKGKNTVRKLLKKYLFKMCDMGESKYIKSIEVNDKEGVYITNKKIIEIPREYLFNSLTKIQRKIILDIFLKNQNLEKINNANILITQPLSEDKLLESERLKIDFYKEIIKEKNIIDNLIIKTHPREITNYSKYFTNVIILDEPFPIEILNFIDNLSFNKIVTLTSTSLKLIKNANEKIILGWDRLYKFKEVKEDKM